MKNPYKTLSSKIIHKNPWFKVLKDKLIRPDGTQGTFYIVDKPPFVASFPLDSTNHTYLVGQYRYSIRQYSWEVPSGQVDQHETPLTAAKRELLEETGIKAKAWNSLGKFFLGAGHHTQVCYVYLAKQLTIGKQLSKPGEVIRLKKTPISKIDQLIKSGIIHDGPSLAAWCKIKSIL